MTKKGLITLIILGLVVVGGILVVPKIIGIINGNDNIIEYNEIDSSQKDDVPEIEKIETSSKRVTIKWSLIKDATEYSIFRKSDGNDFEKVATLKQNESTYTDKKVELNKEYTYKVVAEVSSKSYACAPQTVTLKKIEAPQLTSIKRVPQSQTKEYVNITWQSQKGASYYILRKEKNSSYSILDKVEANSSQTTYKDDKIDMNKDYLYSVRCVKLQSEKVTELGNYDSTGLLATHQKPIVKVDFTNLHANITWNKIDGFDVYDIYRKNGLDDKYTKIKTVKADGKNCQYKDVYHDSFPAKDQDILAAKYFMDASVNGLVYTVRGHQTIGNKNIYSSYYLDGDFHLEAPSIVDVKKINDKKATIEWSTIKNAQKYYIYSGYNDIQGKRHWDRVEEVKTKTTTRQKTTVNVKPSHNFFTVKAVSTKNGNTVYSDYDKGYHINERKYANKNVLFFGDSITFGSPYKGKTTRTVFSYPWRVQQLTNIKYYNPSIPGSTYTYKEKDNRSRMIQIADCLDKGKNVEKKDLTKPTDMYVYKTDIVDNQIHGKKFKDFDVVIMAAGTNDYLDDNPFGSIHSTNIREFNGAINKVMSYVKKANVERNKEGKKAIKIVFVDLFYSDRTNNYAQKTNRFVTKNKIGLTLTDYQNDINALVKKYKQEGLDVYQFATDDLINQKNCPYVASDNLHMTRYAYGQIGNKLSDYLIKNKII